MTDSCDDYEIVTKVNNLHNEEKKEMGGQRIVFTMVAVAATATKKATATAAPVAAPATSVKWRVIFASLP